MSDPGYLRRIVQNLLSNAIRYTQEGKVLLGVRRVGNEVRIEVWDTGDGIAPQDQATIFKEFERLSPTKSDMGLGLGLAIVERACRGLGHEFALNSKVGVGSCFSLTLSTAHSLGPDAQENPQTESSEARHPTTIMSMLIASDKNEISLLTTMIEGFGSSVIHAHDAEEAIAILREIQLVPDGLVIDNNSNAGSKGLEVYRRVEKLCGPMPCAILSSGPISPHSTLEFSADIRLFAKPIDQAELRNLLTVNTPVA